MEYCLGSASDIIEGEASFYFMFTVVSRGQEVGIPTSRMHTGGQSKNTNTV